MLIEENSQWEWTDVYKLYLGRKVKKVFEEQMWKMMAIWRHRGKRKVLLTLENTCRKKYIMSQKMTKEDWRVCSQVEGK